MFGFIVAVLALALLVYCCSNITKEATERAVRRQYQQWHE